MKQAYNDWSELKEINQGTFVIVERLHEEYVAKKLKEAFPNLTDAEAERYSRSDCDVMQDKVLPVELKNLHKELREHICRSCERPLSNNYFICEWSFNQDVHLCEHCHLSLLLREWIEELYESLLKELKQNDEDTKTPQS